MKIEQYEKAVTMENLMEAQKKEFLKGFAHLLECGADKLVPEANLEAIGTWDSMSVMQVQVLIDEIYAKEVDARAIAKCVTFSDVLALVGK